MNSLLTFWDRTYDQLLTIASNSDIQIKANNSYEATCKRRDLHEFREILRLSSQEDLIDRIEAYANNQRQLQNRIRILETIPEKLELLEIIQKSHKMAVLSNKFDEAFSQ